MTQGKVFQSLVLLILALLGLTEQVNATSEREIIKMNNRLEQLVTQGNYDAAKQLAEKVLTQSEALYGASDPQLAVPLLNLAYLYEKMQMNKQAERLYDRVFDLTQKSLVQTQPKGPAVIDKLGKHYITIKNYNKAEAVYERALNINQLFPGENDINTALYLNRLATANQGSGKKELAEVNFQNSYSIFEKTLGPSSPDTLTAINDLGNFYFDSKNYIRARQIYEIIQDREPRFLGNDRESKNRSDGPFWNSWFEIEKKGGNRNITNKIQVNQFQPYTFVLDISPYLYSAIDPPKPTKGGEVGTLLNKTLKDLIKKKVPVISLLVRPVLLGQHLQFTRSSKREFELKISLAELTASDGDKSKLGQVEIGELSVKEFSNAVKAGGIEFNVLANAPGCTAITLSIWDAQGKFPLDHIVRPVTVTEEDSNTTPCEEQGLSFGSGMDTMLHKTIISQTENPKPADAALYIYESLVEGNIRSMAVYIDQKEYEAKKLRQQFDQMFQSWELVGSLSEYLEDKGNLASLIEEARTLATDHVPGEAPIYTYHKVAEELKTVIFSQKGANANGAGKALELLKHLATNTTQRPTLFTRLISTNNESVIFPLGLLSARGHNQILANPITVVQPMKIERYPNKSACINTWTFGIPDALEGEVAEISAPDIDDSIAWFNGRPRKFTDLKNYFAGTAFKRALPNGEGLILLAHHAGGRVWFESDTNRLLPQHFHRSFPSGSVGILTACSLGSSAGKNNKILDLLNDKGIDAALVSPFAIPADYGIRLAQEFAELVLTEKRAKRTPTLMQLFDTAIKNTSQKFRDEEKTEFSEIGLEFIIVGDHSLKLCKS
jgi:tetratricopeptide (TPR) repeat protein